ncbi:MAG TPA: DUF916 domain-containing protein [bacterium]|nr:DUF916 domain-containing protein [bacterium]
MKYPKKIVISSKAKNKVLILVFSLFTLAGFFNLHPAKAIEYGGLGIYPNASEVDEKNPLTKSWFIYILEPGEVKKGKVVIVNTSNELVELEVYPVDAVTTKDGAFAPEPKDKKKIGVGAWTTLAESEISLASKETKTIDFVIEVPEDAEVGDQMGAIIMQNKELSSGPAESGLRIATRVGVRMYITIPGDIIKELEFKEFTQKTEDRIVIFSSTFVNKGNVRIRLKGSIEITDVPGEVVDTLNIPEREVFPNKTITIPVEWNPEALLGGEFKAQALVIYGSNRSLAQELTFSIPFLKQFAAISSFASIGTGVAIGFIVSAIVMTGLYLALKKKLRK